MPACRSQCWSASSTSWARRRAASCSRCCVDRTKGRGEALWVQPESGVVSSPAEQGDDGRKRSSSMETKIVERRTVLKGGAAAFGMLGSGASASMVTTIEQAHADTPPSSLPDQLLSAFQRFRETIPANFDHEYVEKVVRPFFLTSFYEGERPMLPLIDVTFSK